MRGTGLFLGLELVHDHTTKAPAAAHASYLVERMRGDIVKDLAALMESGENNDLAETYGRIAGRS